MAWIGIDPGLHGGIAVLDTAELLIVRPMAEMVFKDGRNPKLSGALLAEWLSAQRAALRTLEHPCPLFVCVEQSQAFPKQGVCSAFNYGSSLAWSRPWDCPCPSSAP